ncbi:MAG: HU family DNA-binding protein [Paludibacter sp.]|nr:HU family DNA-binding protein [Paludibacter sp.]
MSVQYKMVGKNDNLNPEEFKKKGYYPVVVRKKTVGMQELASRASTHCSLNKYEMEMAIKILIETIQFELLESNHVCLEGFGTFSLKAESRNVENPDDLRAESVFVKKVSFKCSPILLSDLTVARFVRYKEK